MSGRAKSVTHLHSFQLALEPPTSLPPQSLPSEPIINFTGAEYIPSSLIQLGSPSKITGTFTSICPFSVEIPLDLLPPQSNHHDQEYVYSLSVIAWFKVTDLSNPHAPRLLSTPSAQTAFTIRRSHGSSRRIGIDSVMDSFKGMDIEMEHHTVRPSFMGPGWHRNGL
ncbi:hypothetical protein FRC03_008706 [Tulasnella sp. 419]|nr:hypothetical protein FRC03_008706 [Tulasnella sp. 419]